MRRITRPLWAAALALVGAWLAWEFVSAFGRWSNGWSEGVSYGTGAAMLVMLARLAARGQGSSPQAFRLWAVLVSIPGLWLTRWAAWLAGAAWQIGTPPPWAPWLLTGLAGLCAMTAWRLWRRSWSG